jgi:hypothetical protein
MKSYFVSIVFNAYAIKEYKEDLEKEVQGIIERIKDLENK